MASPSCQLKPPGSTHPYPELIVLCRRLRTEARKRGLPVWTPGVLLAFWHWWIMPVFLSYCGLVCEHPGMIFICLLCCSLIGVVQAVYGGKCPFIFMERELLSCPTWWRGPPFNIIAGYIQPAVIFGGTIGTLIRFIINVMWS